VTTGRFDAGRGNENPWCIETYSPGHTTGDPWDLIFNRYLKGLSDKVDGLGGDASNVPASPNDKWMDDPGGQPGTPGEIPNNLTEITGEIKDAIHCIGRHSENIGCIRLKKITLDIHFKDKDCC
jgi:hypothetical protein